MRRRIRIFIITLVAAVLIFSIGSAWYFSRALPVFLGFTAKSLCSSVFVSGRPAADVLRQDIQPVVFFSRLIQPDVDLVNKTTAVSLAGIFRKKALYRKECGCTLIPDTVDRLSAIDPFIGLAARRTKLPDDQPWPLGTSAVSGPLPARVDAQKLQDAVADAFVEPATGESRRTRAVVIVYEGRLIAERYAQGFHRGMPLAGWSMTKSILNSLVGILVGKGKLNLHAPAPVSEWQAGGDQRREITLNQLLRMISGLTFSEVYNPPSDVTEMLFESHDFGAAAASKALEAVPGDKWQYSSGTSNIIARIIRKTVEPEYGHTLAYARQELFEPLGMQSAVVEIDPSGTIVGSSYGFATARDWARLGLLYLQDGIWQGRQILPPGWVAYTRTPTASAPKGQYGAHFWLNAGPAGDSGRRRWPALPADMMVAWGFQGQFLVVIPSKRLVLVRLGLNTGTTGWDLERFVNLVIMAFH